MISSIPVEIQSQVKAKFGDIKSFQPASGGCINNGGRIEIGNNIFFIKWNSANLYPEMFNYEAKGLELLRTTGCVIAPEFIELITGEKIAAILIEYIEKGAQSSGYWQKLAEDLACLHAITRDKFGLDHHNYIGSLRQYNNEQDSAVEFFIECRLKPQIRLAFNDQKLNKRDVEQFEKLYNKLDGLLINEPPSLIHGDLWAGNLMTNPQGQPVLIDPAVAYAPREMELAFTQLFGGFDSQFYHAYNEIFPIQPGHDARFDIYNLYPLLVHVNLFGGGYYSQVKYTLQRYT